MMFLAGAGPTCQHVSSLTSVGTSLLKLLRTTIRAPRRGLCVKGGSCGREAQRSAALSSAGDFQPYSLKSRNSCLSLKARVKSQESRVESQELRVESQESRVKSQESRVRSRESRVESQESRVCVE